MTPIDTYSIEVFFWAIVFGFKEPQAYSNHALPDFITNWKIEMGLRQTEFKITPL